MNHTECNQLQPNCQIIHVRAYNPSYYSYVISKREWFDVLTGLGLLESNDWDLTQSIRGFKLMSTILRKYFRFNPKLESEVNNMLQAYNKESLIGIHLRMSDSSSDFKEAYISEHFIFEEDALSVLRCKYINHSHNPVLYVASDSSSIKKEIAKQSNVTVITSNMKSLHTGHNMEQNQRNEALRAVVLDIIALSKCKTLIVTKGSSLSYIAAAFQGSVPYYISRNTSCFFPKELTTLVPRAWS